MKRIGSTCIAIAVVIVLSSVASATKWNYLGVSSPEGNYIYVDADSVVKEGEMMSCWVLQDLGIPGPHGEKKIVSKLEFIIANRVQFHEVETYTYDSAGNLLHEQTSYDSAWTIIAGADVPSAALEAALKYAKVGKVGKGMGPRPSSIVAP